LPDTDIVDLGCALGEGIRPLLDLPNTFLGYESSHAMVEEASKRFNADTNVVISEYDLRNGFPDVSPSVVLSILTLQFIPIEYRQQLLTQVYDSLQPGGAFILVEKLLGNGGTLDSMMVGLYYDMKKDNGYSQEEIDRKRLSLEGQLVPLTPEMNEAILKGAGFTTVDCFWRWMNFGGWIAIKEG
jgi:tRNA (cmo5U34)-methyltransferase